MEVQTNKPQQITQLSQVFTTSNTMQKSSRQESEERGCLNELTCPTEDTPLSVLPHLEYIDVFLSPTKSLVFSRALKISPCIKKITKLAIACYKTTNSNIKISDEPNQSKHEIFRQDKHYDPISSFPNLPIEIKGSRTK